MIIRIETEPCHIYHFANCREDFSGVIKFEACCLPKNFTMEWQDRVFLANGGDAPGVMHSYVVDPRNGGSLSRRPLPGLETTACEFPTTNPFRHVVTDPNLSTRYFYLMAGEPGISLPYSDVVKYDTVTQKTQRWHSEGVVGEPCFIPRLGRASAFYGDEDDGWIIVQLYLHEEDRVQFCVLNARKVEEGPVCRIKVPWKLPYGFHGTWSDQVFDRGVARL
jgi:all-trans-8'-apo-beta-carotenal 15,15'-oxygenase